ncbi:GNAT family N-acetyltransferase [Longispora albida]|uniref:GNAT family N-acetyltransferase n=1 Tax=Longispora albida TaxID=203523 RepID=UPI00037C274A|nr:GNAT family N-acetyltransferase [Longispora albida]
MRIEPYEAGQHEPAVAAILAELGWEPRFVDGQLGAVARLAASEDGRVLVASTEAGPVGYVSAVLARWNMFGQIHGLAVHPAARRQGIADALVGAVGTWLREAGARAVQVDTPVDNDGGRRFYEAAGFTADYVMTRYYADDLDGVTYVRFL